MSDNGETGQRRQRAITPGGIDPARSQFIDTLLLKRRLAQAAGGLAPGGKLDVKQAGGGAKRE